MNFRAISEIIKDTLRETLSSKVFYVLLVFSTLLAGAVCLFYIEDTSQGNFKHTTVSFAGKQLFASPNTTVKEVQANILVFIANSICGLFGLLTAIIITGSFVPRMFRSGTIELYLSRSVQRWEILLAKYIGGLSFVFFQACWLVGLLFFAFGIRSGIWTLDFLWAIPILTFLFAILYSFSVLMAVMWKNTAPTIFLTIAFWIVCGMLGKARAGVEAFIVMNERQEQSYTQLEESGFLSDERKEERDAFIETQQLMRTFRKWLLVANYILPPTTELDQVATALYSGKKTVQMPSVKKDIPVKKKTKEPSDPKSLEVELIDVEIAMMRPFLTCLGFITVCMGGASFLFYRKEF
ncbi:hypothetical protein MNBD_PLANCTO02-2271 [hydrothermal vent metagenome]|uniref:ABC-type transport system involved in multi-copper enzyme maturation, permease component n=1 Tax=hydrothermal vent metagenome TaxID=652676 RepID=A0A3B1DXK3_9ZZZZ